VRALAAVRPRAFRHGDSLVDQRRQLRRRQIPGKRGCDRLTRRQIPLALMLGMLGQFTRDGNTIMGRGQLSKDGITWEGDLDLDYRRLGSQAQEPSA
jgi:hypothetical protein